MKIAVLSPVAWRTPPVHYGPWEQVASNVTEGLTAMGLDVTLFATADAITTSARLNAVVKEGYETDKTVDAKVVECLHISNLMEHAHEFDIIHNHYDFLPLTYSSLIKTPVITTIHGFSSQKIIPVYKKYNNSSHYVSISNADRSEQLKYLATVYNGLKTDDFIFEDKPDDYLLFFGRIHPDKGTFEAIEIAKKAKRKLIIAGIVQDAAYFEEKIKPTLNEQIMFIGHAGVEERKQLLSKAFALLHPINFNEPFGLSVAESMLCGTPVIAFNRGSMPELIQHEKTGFLVSNIAEAVAAVNDIRIIDRKYCKQHATANFSREKMTADYYALYQKILG